MSRLVLLLKLPEAFDFLPTKLVMKRQLLGYDAMFQTAGPYLVAGEKVIAADYKLASLATYYLHGQPAVTVLTPSRVSQYDYWRRELPVKPGEEAHGGDSWVVRQVKKVMPISDM